MVKREIIKSISTKQLKESIYFSCELYRIYMKMKSRIEYIVYILYIYCIYIVSKFFFQRFRLFFFQRFRLQRVFFQRFNVCFTASLKLDIILKLAITLKLDDYLLVNVLDNVWIGPTQVRNPLIQND